MEEQLSEEDQDGEEEQASEVARLKAEVSELKRKLERLDNLHFEILYYDTRINRPD